MRDDEKRRKKIADLVQKNIPTTYRVHRVDPAVVSTGTGTYEDKLKSLFGVDKFAETALFVTDRDLSKNPGTPGLSEAAVSKAAALLGVPVCVYSAGKNDSVLERQRSGGDGRIILDSSDFENMADKIAVLAKGFERLRTDLTRAMSPASSVKKTGPAGLLAQVLGHGAISNHIAMYISGDQRMISELMPLSKKADTSSDRNQHMITALGTWLYDSVMRFPGVLVDQTAAASFLNIQVKQFAQGNIRRLFGAALYDGPFSGESNPYWWRHILMDLLNDAKVAEGRGLAEAKLQEKVAPCLCSVDGQDPAGFVCAVTLKPVCKKHSVGQIGWLPRGADLTRVRKDVYDELSPWIGVS